MLAVVGTTLAVSPFPEVSRKYKKEPLKPRITITRSKMRNIRGNLLPGAGGGLLTAVGGRLVGGSEEEVGGEVVSGISEAGEEGWVSGKGAIEVGGKVGDGGVTTPTDCDGG